LRNPHQLADPRELSEGSNYLERADDPRRSAPFVLDALCARCAHGLATRVEIPALSLENAARLGFRPSRGSKAIRVVETA
jgi:hypothetical protein